MINQQLIEDQKRIVSLRETLDCVYDWAEEVLAEERVITQLDRVIYDIEWLGDRLLSAWALLEEGPSSPCYEAFETADWR